MLKISGLKKLYNNRVVLDEVSLTFEDNSVVGLFGKNGSGKSTFLKCLSGLIEYSGDIKHNGISLKKNFNYQRHIGVLLENPYFYDSLSGEENLDYFLHNAREAKLILKYLDMELFLRQKTKTYSLGMKQKLGFALACAKGDKIVLLDEPFNGMDLESVKKCKIILNKLKNLGRIIFVSSHQIDTLEGLCDNCFFIENSKIEQFDKKDYYHFRKYMLTFLSIDEAKKAMIPISISYNSEISNNKIFVILNKYDRFVEMKYIASNYALLGYDLIEEEE